MGAVASPAELDRALTVLAHYGGNAARASQELGIPRSTLSLWKARTHRERYLEIAEREGPRLEALAVAQARETIIRAGETEHRLFDVIDERLNEAENPAPERDDFVSDILFEAAYATWLKRGSSKELSELAGTVQRISTSKGINGTKLLELTGRPTSIVEHRDPGETINALARKLGITVDSTAVEIPPEPSAALLAESGDANARDVTEASHVEPAAD